LREEGNVQSDSEKVFLHRYCSAIAIYYVTHCLKGEEGNAKREVYVRHREGSNLPHCQKAVHLFHEEGGILEETQQAKIQQYCKNKKYLFASRKATRHEGRHSPVHYYGSKHEEGKPSFAIGVEDEAGAEEKKVPSPGRKSKVSEQSRRQKDEKKGR